MKDALGHGSNSKGGSRPLPGHPYHTKTDAELRYISKDAHEAGRNAQNMGDERGVNKYADQVNDAQTVLGYRSRGGQSDAATADQLHSGTAKSDPAPVHEAMGGPGAVVSAMREHFKPGTGAEATTAVLKMLKGYHRVG